MYVCMHTQGPAAGRAPRPPQAVREREPGARAQRPRPGPALWAGVAEPGHSPSTARRVCLPAEPLLSLRVPAHLCLLVARHAVPEAVEEDCRLRLEDCGADLDPRGLPKGEDIGSGQRRPGEHHIKERRRNPAAERAEPSTAHQRNAPEVPTSSPPAGRALRRAYAARDSIFWSGIVRAPITRSCPYYIR